MPSISLLISLKNPPMTLENFNEKLSADFEYGLKLVREKTGKHRFFITKYALIESRSIYQ